MNLPFQKDNVTATLPEDVAQVLSTRFFLQRRMLAGLGCFEKKGFLGGAPVDFIRVVDLGKAQGMPVKARAYGDFDRHEWVVLFDGYRDSQGCVRLTGRHPVPNGVGGPTVAA